ncbi:hypothetical protein J6590_102862 [Homalodisca vitripennis]|nr:hypothetical protein J6590_102862 [Homalodisca vitripennis]
MAKGPPLVEIQEGEFRALLSSHDMSPRKKKPALNQPLQSKQEGGGTPHSTHSIGYLLSQIIRWKNINIL